MNEGSGARVAYFGKIPARGDFVTSDWPAPFLLGLDTWITRTMEILAHDLQWKPDYDRAPGWDFAFLRSAGRPSLVGHVVASRDAAGRRFPLGAAAQIDPGHAVSFAAHAPLALGPAWARIAAACRAVCGQDDIATKLSRLNELRVPVAPAPERELSAFLEGHTLKDLAATLADAGHDAQPEEIVMALGVLLEPALARGAGALERGLVLPLPRKMPGCHLVAAFWTALIVPFLSRHPFDVVLRIGDFQGRSRLVVGFQGISPEYLACLFLPKRMFNTHMVLDGAPWSHAHARASSRLTKLASYLDQPRLALHTTMIVFREVFLGS